MTITCTSRSSRILGAVLTFPWITGAVACIVLGLASVGCSPAPAPEGERPKATSAKVDAQPADPADTGFAGLVDQWTGGRAQPLAGRQPDHVVGDFDGDGYTDAAVPILFKTKGAPRELDKVTVLNPWLLSVEPNATNPYDTDSDKALLVLHGTTKEWSDAPPVRAYVLLDAVYDEMTVLSRGAKVDGVKVPTMAKGDCLLTGTEDARGVICWDGKTYRWDQRGD